MPARPRSEIVDESEPGFYHCFSRCVRRAYLFGRDKYAKKNYDHRKVWVEKRLKFLASQMAVEVTSHAILDNHLHVVLRNRPDIVEKWSNKAVARRWLTLCPGKRELDPEAPPTEPTKQQISALVADKDKLAECRKRLSSISWCMKFLKEFLARKCNEEDSLTGAFFESRFRSTRLLDMFALVLCSMYVDLNPVRAGKTNTPETSENTSIYLRIQARLGRQPAKAKKRQGGPEGDRLAAAWLTPIDEDAPPPDGPQAERGRRVSDRGFLPMTLEKYLNLVDWSGRELRAEKRGSIPSDLAPILDRLGLEAEFWLQGLLSFREWFSDFAGRPSTLRAYAAKIGCRALRGTGQS